MHGLFAFMFLTHFLPDLCYELECPNKSQWYLRSTASCNSSDLYGCLFDEIYNIHNERCLKSPRFANKGRKNVYSGGIDRVPCKQSRYQPFIFSTNGNDDCVYSKSICSLEGQVVYDDGDSDNDRSCRCDYTYGYAFVQEPAETCKCFPLTEDCSCYRKYCPFDSVLSPDYQCIPVQNWKGSITCPHIDATNIKTDDNYPQIRKVLRKNHTWGTGLFKPASTVILVLFLICCGLSILFIFLNHNFYDSGTHTDSDTSENVQINRIKTISTTHPNPPTSTAIQALKMVPAFEQSATFDEIKHFVDFYHTDLSSPSTMPSELRLWQKACESMLSKPETIAGALKVCCKADFPNISVILKIIATMGMTSCECERSNTFSRDLELKCLNELGTIASNAKEKIPKPHAHFIPLPSNSTLKFLTIATDFKQKLQELISPSFDIYMSQRIKTLNRWRDTCTDFVKTSTYTKILDCARKYNCILVTGMDGTGITSIMRNVVVYFETEDFDIYPISTPEYIEKLYTPFKKILFVVENICGRYDCIHYDIQLWKSWEIYIKKMLDDKNVKFIVSCRHRVVKDSQFQKLKLFHSCICDISDAIYEYTENDLKEIAKIYNIRPLSHIKRFSQVYKKSESFPLLCSLYKNIIEYNHGISVNDFFITPYSIYEIYFTELFSNKAFAKYCGLALCVMFNNHLEEAIFIGEISDEIQLVFKDTCDACRLPTGISRSVLLKALQSLEGLVLKNENGIYSTIHDRLFDFLIYFFGNKIIECIINHSEVYVILQRFIFKEYLAKSNEYKILIPENVLQMYFERLLHDWSNREIVNVFSNKNLIDETFQGQFTYYINAQRSKSEREYLANLISFELHETPLTMSCSKGYDITVRWLINNDANVNKCRYDGASPLLLACKEGYSEIVTELISAGSDMNLPDIDGKDPLYVACQYNHHCIANILLEKDADPNSYTDHEISPLIVASENGNTDIVSCLLHNHSDVNYCTSIGISALFVACEKGHAGIAKFLIDRGADVNLCIQDGSSSLYIACQNGHLSTVNTLLDADLVDINKSSYSGATSLSIACQEGHVKIVETLIKHNANVNIYRDVSPLFAACKQGHLEVVKVLLQNEIDVNKGKFKSLTPLYIACQQGNTKIVAELLKKNADINMCSAEGKSPVFIACQENQFEVVCLLLDMKEKLEINKCTIDQRSPLFEACLRGNLDIIKELVKKGADINIVNNKGQSALSVASKNKRDIIEKILQEKKKERNSSSD